MKHGGILLVMFVALLSGCTPPNVDNLDQDISELTSTLQVIEAELAKYEGGLISDLIETRKQLTSATKEMLEQKRASLLYWIELMYPIEGNIQTLANEETLKEIRVDIGELESQVAAAKAEANSSGGLIGVMKKAQVATLQLTIATVNHRYYAEKYGVPVVFSPSDDRSDADREIIDPSEL